MPVNLNACLTNDSRKKGISETRFIGQQRRQSIAERMFSFSRRKLAALLLVGCNDDAALRLALDGCNWTN